MSNKSNSTYFPALNMLRCIAALFILIYHQTIIYHENYTAYIVRFLNNLVIGVDLFFIISGFLIVYLLVAEKSNTNTIQLKNFYLRRVLRIFPLYYFIIILAAIVYYNKSQFGLNQFSLFVGNFWMIKHSTWTVGMLNPLWSLCIEEHFYIVIPLLIFIIPKPYLIHLFVIVIVLSLGFKTYYAVQPNQVFIMYCHTLARVDELAIGGLLAVWYNNNNKRFNISAASIIVVGIVLFVIMIVGRVGYLSTSNYAAIWVRYLYVGPLVFLFCGLVLNTKQFSFINKIINNKIINHLGKISFGLYMLHQPLLDLVAYWLPAANNILLLRVGINMVLTIGLASLSFTYYEGYFLKLKEKFSVKDK
jgi:peptidoglycan/LPS O-acetylase OafA/YrhL